MSYNTGVIQAVTELMSGSSSIISVSKDDIQSHMQQKQLFPGQEWNHAAFLSALEQAVVDTSICIVNERYQLAVTANKRAPEEENREPEDRPTKRANTKKKTTKKNATDKNATDKNKIVSEDALGLVMKFCDARGLYALAFSTKKLMGQVTTEMVIRAAMIQGGFAAKTLHDLYILCQHERIYKPSTLRLLRLVNGKRCECCHQNKVNKVRKEYGVFVCYDCMCNRTTKLFHLQDEDRTAHFYRPGSRNISDAYFVWNETFVPSDGENCGPIITIQNMQSRSWTELIRSQQDYSEILNPFPQACKVAEDSLRIQEKRKLQASKAAAASFKEKVLCIFKSMQAAMDERWRDFALTHTYHGDNVPKAERFTLSCFLVKNNKKLQEIIAAPSKSTKAKLRAIVAEIEEQFHVIQSSGFLNFDYFDDSYGTELGSAISKEVRQEFPSLQSLVFWEASAQEPFLNNIQRGNMLEASRSFHRIQKIIEDQEAMVQNTIVVAAISRWQNKMDDRWKDFALEYEFDRGLNFKFENPMVSNSASLRNLLRDESITVTDALMDEVFAEIDGQIRLVADSGILELGFIGQDDIAGRSMAEKLRERFPSLKSFLSSSVVSHLSFLTRCRSGQIHEAAKEIVSRLGLFLGTSVLDPYIVKTTKGRFVCELCQTGPMRSNIVSQHLKGHRHAYNLSSV